MQADRQGVAGAAKSAVERVFGAGQGAAPNANPPQPAAEAAAVPAPDAANPDVANTGGSLDAAAPNGDMPPIDGEPVLVAEVPDKGRDPFRPFTLDLHPTAADAEVVTPLQRYELPQLRLAGVVLDLQTPRAMLQDNSGMGFIVTPGTPIGRRRGVVKAIESRRVVVEETVLDYYGREQISQVVIEMPKEEKQSASQE
jgi:type IV pilus assembly protein PilP